MPDVTTAAKFRDDVIRGFCGEQGLVDVASMALGRESILAVVIREYAVLR